MQTHDKCALFLDMGLGKTVTCLTRLADLKAEGKLHRALVIAPKRVAEDTWPKELKNWEHLQGLTLSLVAGTEAQRRRALQSKADIYVIGRDNVAWLIASLAGAWPFPDVIVDESSSFKNSKSKRFRALRMVAPKIERLTLLTGTPTSNSLLDLWPQIYLLDRGERLGKTLSAFQDRYFVKDSEYKMHPNYVLRPFKPELPGDDLIGDDYYEAKIHERLSDICISMKAKDYLDMPKRVDRTRSVVLEPAVAAKMRDFERRLYLEMAETGEKVTAISAASLSMKLRQFANGFMYDAERKAHFMHDAKIEALAEELEAANGSPMLVFYQFDEDLTQLLHKFKAYKPELLRGKAEGVIDRWNEGHTRLLFAHPKSAGHGLNLQHGGHLLTWFGADWSLEAYQQGVTRLDRQGQKKPVINTLLITQGTIEDRIVQTLQDNEVQQDALMEALKFRAESFGVNLNFEQ
jgi:SNF2 family DNA or RNA helicase